jgi:hypothetical protein
MKVASWVQVHRPTFRILRNISNADIALEVDDGHIRLDGRPIQGRGGSLPPLLARLVPWRCANREALRSRNNTVESIKLRPRDQGRLVVDPQFFDGLERVSKDDTLADVSYERMTAPEPRTLLPSLT